MSTQDENDSSVDSELGIKSALILQWATVVFVVLVLKWAFSFNL